MCTICQEFRICTHLPKKPFPENFIFLCSEKLLTRKLHGTGDKQKSQNNEAYDKCVKIKTLKVKLCLFLGRGLFGRRERRLGLKKEVFLGLRYVCVHLIVKRKLRN